MPISNCPFKKLYDNDIDRAILPIQIINPHTDLFVDTFGIIDTGADECAVPASIALPLGHKLLAGSIREIKTGNGITKAYSHTTIFKIFHPESYKLLYTLPETPIDFLPNLNVVLLGVKSFLNKFVLNIDYPKRVFSIKKP